MVCKIFLGFLYVKSSFIWTSQRRNNLSEAKYTAKGNYSVLKANHISHHITQAEEIGKLQQVGRCTWHSDAHLNFIWTTQMPQFYNTKLWILLFSSEAFEVLLHEVYKHPFFFRMKKTWTNILIYRKKYKALQLWSQSVSLQYYYIIYLLSNHLSIYLPM